MDLRISVLPTSHGERIVMRLLDTRADLLDVTNIGFPEDIDRAFPKKQYTRPNGILLVTGPTGSGKSTTLYSVLNTIKSREKILLQSKTQLRFKLREFLRFKLSQRLILHLQLV